MANIKQYTDKIRTAVYGKEVRGSLAEGMEAINNEVESNTKHVNYTVKDIENFKDEISKAEAIRVSSENSRKQEEKNRVLNEDNRKTNENTRISNENARKTNEENRVSSETSRKNNEVARTNNEDLRKREENTRIASENTRKANEAERVNNEELRKQEEKNRVANENARKTNENTRISNETNRTNKFNALDIQAQKMIKDIKHVIDSNKDKFTTATRVTKTDFNTLTLGGYYAISGACPNAPLGSDGYLSIIPWDTPDWCTQIFINDVQGDFYIRTKTGSATSAWTSWSKVYDSNHKPTPSEIGAVSLVDMYNHITFKDTRNDNQPPSYYLEKYTKQKISEFKFGKSIGIFPNNSTEYGILTTTIPWGDKSGGYPVQIFLSYCSAIYTRSGKSEGEWNPWRMIYDSKNKPTPNDIGAVCKTGDKITGTLNFNCSGNEIEIQSSNTTDQARGIVYKNSAGNAITGMIGSLMNKDHVSKTFMGATDNPWNGVNSLTVDAAGAYFDNKRLLSTNDLSNGKGQGIPIIGADSVMEVGSMIDFHANSSVKDYSVRVEVDSNSLFKLQGCNGLIVNNREVQLAASTTPLWQGCYYMSNGQNITLSKSIDQCQNGIILVWGDYDAPSTQTNCNYTTFVIPKNAGINNSGNYLCGIPYSENTGWIIKAISVRGNTILGNSNDTQNGWNDVVLYKVLEY